MNIDYNKIVLFLLSNIEAKKEGLSEVLKEVLKDYCMINVDNNEKSVLLKSRKTKRDFVMKARGKGILIFPSNYRAISFLDDFEEIIEIRVNDENNVVLSSIGQSETPKGIYVAGSNWLNGGENLYTQTIGRMLYMDTNSLIQLGDRQSIEMFINQYNIKRNDIFCDLYWDMNSYFKSIFVEPKGIYKVQINDGNFKEDFPSLYKKYRIKIKELLVPKLF